MQPSGFSKTAWCGSSQSCSIMFFFLFKIDKLVKAGANILSPIPIGPKRIIGTAVDYAYYMFNQVRQG